MVGMTHNHPKDPPGFTPTGGHLGVVKGLSGADAKTAARLDLRFIRAVHTDGDLFILEPGPNGWPSSHAVETTYNYWNSLVINDIRTDVLTGRIDLDNPAHCDEIKETMGDIVMEKTAKRLGMTYRRVKPQPSVRRNLL